MTEVLDAYAALKWKFDALEKEYASCAVDFKNLYEAIKDKIVPTNDGRIADYAISYLKRLEDRIKDLEKPSVLSDEGRLEVMTNGQA